MIFRGWPRPVTARLAAVGRSDLHTALAADALGVVALQSASRNASRVYGEFQSWKE